MGQAGKIVSVYFREGCRGRTGAAVTYETLQEAYYAIATLHGTVIPGDSRYIECKIDGVGEFAPVDISKVVIPPKPDPAVLAAKRKAEEPPLPPADPQPRKQLRDFKGSPATQMARRILSKEFMQGEVA